MNESNQSHLIGYFSDGTWRFREAIERGLKEIDANINLEHLEPEKTTRVFDDVADFLLGRGKIVYDAESVLAQPIWPVAPEPDEHQPWFIRYWGIMYYFFEAIIRRGGDPSFRIGELASDIFDKYTTKRRGVAEIISGRAFIQAMTPEEVLQQGLSDEVVAAAMPSVQKEEDIVSWLYRRGDADTTKSCRAGIARVTQSALINLAVSAGRPGVICAGPVRENHKGIVVATMAVSKIISNDHLYEIAVRAREPQIRFAAAFRLEPQSLKRLREDAEVRRAIPHLHLIDCIDKGLLATAYHNLWIEPYYKDFFAIRLRALGATWL